MTETISGPAPEPYANARTVYDADSHVMELTDFLLPFADPGIRERLRPLHLGGAGALAEDAVAKAEARRASGEEVAESEILKLKGWHAAGAFDPGERSRTLDRLGFAAQLVFSTFSPTQFAGDDVDLLFGGTRAHNRAMVDFCAADRRLLPVCFVPWGPPELTFAAAREALELGAAAILVPSLPPRDAVSPTHPDHHRLWRMLEEAEVPFVLHIGGGGRPVRPAFHRNGIEVTDFLGGGENIRSKDYMAISHSPEIFLASMVMDGILDRFPNLMGGSIEQGALWVVTWMRKLDLAQKAFGRTESVLRELPLHPSDYVSRQLRFTPFPGEPVRWMIEQTGPELFMFSSDYPHPEGTRDPIGRFEATLTGTDGAARDRFYRDNFAELMHGRLPAAP
jgi:predicted TIM-barrel fold metal-dependent hydrolase